ncbi:hypothetical protein [Phenylobacterium sp.]|uniref:hypothetical protein n=1 Tax=Phenylobacterium sp. TaxID=1871053 RepID=UPI002FC74391
MSERQTVAGAYAKIKAHDDLCAERLLNIHGRIDLLFKVIGWGGALAVSILIAVAGYGMNKIVSGQQEQLRLLYKVRTEISAPVQP